MVGISRKGFLARTVADALHLAAPPAPADRLHPSTAANVAAILAGAHILRVHDLRPAREAAAVADAVLAAVNPVAGSSPPPDTASRRLARSQVFAARNAAPPLSVR